MWQSGAERLDDVVIAGMSVVVVECDAGFRGNVAELNLAKHPPGDQIAKAARTAAARIGNVVAARL